MMDEGAYAATLAAISARWSWSPWLPFRDGVARAPRLPGVYMMRDARGSVVYVGMAGERPGGGRPSGLRGRLTVYATGKGAVSGFGEAALDRALANEAFVIRQLQLLQDEAPRRTKLWAQDAIAWHGIELRWAVLADRAEAKRTEEEIVDHLKPFGLWNR